MTPRLLVLLGPTGTGKSALALALAQRLGGEIVGCDALQVYCGFDVATAKPGAEVLRLVPHHLVDCVDPRTDFTLADYVREAERAIAAIAARGRVPIVAGGTGLYLRGLLRGIIAAPPRDEALRGRLRRIAERGGAGRLRRLLARRDPRSAARIAPRDTQRLVRALELAWSPSSWSARLEEAGTWRAGVERFPSVKVGLDTSAARLNESLDRRVAGFFAAGVAAEVAGLLQQGVPASANAFKAIGYRESLAALRGELDPACACAAAQRATRRYAKRQRTWFRREPGVVWLDAAAATETLLAAVVGLWSGARPVSGMLYSREAGSEAQAIEAEDAWTSNRETCKTTSSTPPGASERR